jgi:hypothetical protein
MVEHTKRSDARDSQRTPALPGHQETYSPDAITSLQQTLGNTVTEHLLTEQLGVSGAIPVLQHAIGNTGVQRLIQRQPGIDFSTGFIHELKTTCVTREFPKKLSNDELAQGIQALTAHLQTLQTSDSMYQAAADNLQTLQSEVTYRQREQTMTGHLNDVTGAGNNNADHNRETDELIAYARSQLDTYPPMVDTFVRQATPDVNEKVRVLGEVSALAARMEFFLGSIYHRGSDDWEVNAAGAHTENRGHMVDYYTGGNDIQWCSRFATTARAKVLGSNDLLAASGYKIANPHTNDWDIDLDYSAQYGGDFAGMRSGANATAGNNPWAALRQRLTQINGDASIADKPQAKAEAVDNFFNTHIRPQPGDMMIVRRGAANKNSFTGTSNSHTTMVECLDGYQLSTVEGNSGSRVTGHVFDLTNPADVEEIIYVARPSLATGRTAAQEAQIGAGVPAGTAIVGEQQLLEPLQQMNEMLERFAANAGYVNNIPAGGNNSVANLD